MFGNELFGKDKNGGHKIWGIEVEAADLAEDIRGAIIRTYYGKEGGDYALTTDTEVVHSGKQKRTAYEQAVFQAQAKIKKKLDAGYRETKEELEEVPLLPMLAMNYHKVGHRMNFEDGVHVPDKLDGLRCLVKYHFIEDSYNLKACLLSRTGQPYELPHVEMALVDGCFPKVNEPLDGEIYYHGASLQDITSAVKRTDTQKEIDKVLRDIARLGADYRRPSKVVGVESPTLAEELEHAEYIHWLRPRLKIVLFDMPSGEKWVERLKNLIAFGKSVVSEYIELVDYPIVHSEEEMITLHDDARERGYEGVMLRNRDGLYESGKRSADLQKYKRMVGDNVEDKDTEFLIVGMKADKNGNGVYICKNDVNDLTFTVVWGSFKERLEALQNADKIIGKKYLKVKYQTRYDRTLLPQFPAGKGLREGKFINEEFVPSE